MCALICFAANGDRSGVPVAFRNVKLVWLILNICFWIINLKRIGKKMEGSVER
jgi:hypothetical protein